MSWRQYLPTVEPMLPHPPDDAVATDSWAHPMTDVRRRVTQLCTIGIVVVVPIFPPATTDAGGGTISATGTYTLHQYQSLAGPLDTTPFLFITQDWQTPHRPMPRLVIPRPATGAVAPIYVPDVTTGTPQAPSAVTPDWVLGRPRTAQQAQTWVAPLHVPEVTDPVTPLQWRGIPHPDILFRTTLPSAAQPVHVGPSHVPDVTQAVPDSSWQGSYPALLVRSLPRAPWFPFLFRPAGDIVEPVSTAGGGSISTRSRKLWQYQALTGPFVPSPAVVPDSSWTPMLVDRPGRRTLPTAQQAAWTMDRFDAPAAPAVPDAPTWHPTYPDRLPPPLLRTATTFTIDSQWTAPLSFVQQVGLGFLPSLPAVLPRILARHQHVWAQPHFVLEVAVPVMAWTGVYLDPPVRRISPRAGLYQGFNWPSNIADVTQTVQESSWDSSFPDLVWARRHASKERASATAIFVPDVTITVPRLSWLGRYPDRVWARKPVASQKEFAFDAVWTAPAAPTVPALSVAVYPDRVRTLAPLTAHPAHLWPALVLDVTVPVTPNSWTPIYPDRVVVALRFPERHEGFTPEPRVIPQVLFLAAWAKNANRYLAQPIDLLQTDRTPETIDGQFEGDAFDLHVFFVDDEDDA